MKPRFALLAVAVAILALHAAAPATAAERPGRTASATARLPGRPLARPPLVGKCRQSPPLARQCGRIWNNCRRAHEGPSVCAGWFGRCCNRQSVLGSPLFSTP